MRLFYLNPGRKFLSPFNDKRRSTFVPQFIENGLRNDDLSEQDRQKLFLPD
ncbi:MAG: hypothetical protein WBD27_08475 [Pyrinomonadaceae bacterium]